MQARLGERGLSCAGTCNPPYESVTLAASKGAEIHRGPSFLYLPEAGAFACAPRALAQAELARTVRSALASAGWDPEIAVVFTTAWMGCDDIYYVPLANDVRGIGYGRTQSEELFDDSQGSSLAGIAFLNDLPYWLEHPDEFRTAFLHEVGHRWGARVHASTARGELELTGREGAHWSYFFESGGSPLEGNLFSEGAPWTTRTPRHPDRYGPLDLYLMGALAPEDVGPLRFFVGEAPGVDCRVAPVRASSPPQTCEPKELTGELVEFGVEDIVRAEGPREPTARARDSVRVAFLVLETGERWGSEGCSSFERMTSGLVDDFARATEGALTLAPEASGEGACEDWPEPEEPASGCAFRGAPGRGPWWRGGVLALFFGALFRRCAARGALFRRD